MKNSIVENLAELTKGEICGNLELFKKIYGECLYDCCRAALYPAGLRLHRYNFITFICAKSRRIRRLSPFWF